jgi:hypothetical protein
LFGLPTDQCCELCKGKCIIMHGVHFGSF